MIKSINYEKLTVAYLSCFGFGKIKYAPGTFGSLFGLFVLMIPEEIRFFSIYLLIILNFLLSWKLINKLNGKFGADPGWIVIDEAIGIWITIASPFVPHNLIWIVIAFVLFRFFDILKPFPINKLNDREKGIFVILDDVLAGVFALIVLHLFYLAYQILPFSYFFVKKMLN